MAKKTEREYLDHEFCKAVGCQYLNKEGTECVCFIAGYPNRTCSRTAKEFHKWIIRKDGKITMPAEGMD